MLKTLFLAFFVAGVSLHAGWEKVDERNGIKSYGKTVKGSPIMAFKGEAIIPAPLEKLLTVLLDNKHRTDWVDRLKTSQFLENKTKYNYVLHQEFHVPFPFTNRDFVYRGKATRVPGTNKVILKLHSEPHKGDPGVKGVRAKLYHSAYTLTPMGKNKTKLEVEIHSDPKGWLPKWLVNMIQKSWPYKTLSGISKEVQKEWVKAIPLPPKANAKA